MRSLSILPCVILFAVILQIACDGENEPDSLNKYSGGQENCADNDEKCDKDDNQTGSDEDNTPGSGEDDQPGSDECEGDSDEQNDDEEICEISCFCHDDQQSVCVKKSQKNKSASGQQEDKDKDKDSGQGAAKPRSDQSGAGVAAGAAAGAAAAGAAAVAASQNQKKKPQQKPPPANSQPKPQQPESKEDDSKCNWCIRPKCNPGACQAKPNFDAKADASALHKAMKGLGTKESVLLDILTHRSEEQLEQIRQEYQGLGGGLNKDVAGDTSFKVKDLLLALLKTRADFFADELKDAFKGPDASAMIMILTSLSPCAIREIGTAYEKKNNNKPLVEAAADASALKFEDFLVELIKGNREKDGPVDEDRAKKDAEALKNAGPESWLFKDKNTFIDIFTHRSFSHLKKVKEEYNKMKPEPGFDEDIEKHSGGGKLTEGLMVMMKNVEDQPGYFANEIEGSVNNLLNPFGIRDNKALIRILRGRCGIDLGDIKDAYPKNHSNRKLIDKLKEKSVGDYQDALVALCT